MGFISGLFGGGGDDSGQAEAEEERRQRLAKEQRELKEAEERRTRYMRERFTGGGLAGGDQGEGGTQGSRTLG